MKTCMTALILIALFAMAPSASATENAPAASVSAAPAVAMPVELPAWLTGTPATNQSTPVRLFNWQQGGPNCREVCRTCIVELGEPCCQVAYDVCGCC